MKAYVVTFANDQGRRYNVWVWPPSTAAEGGRAVCEVNEDTGDGRGWLPFKGEPPLLEVQQ